MDTLTAATRKAASTWLRDFIAGPKHLRWTALPIQSGDPAPTPIARTVDGKDFALHHVWEERPAVIIFLRHFGCGCAWQRAERLVAEYPRLVAAGATVVTIGQGDPARCQWFGNRTGLPCPVLSDEGRLAYEAFGLLEARPSQVVYGMPEGFLRRDPKLAEDFLKSRLGSERIPVDSPWQLPGEFVVDTKGVVKLAHRSQYCADYADPDVLIAAITDAILGL